MSEANILSGDMQRKLKLMKPATREAAIELHGLAKVLNETSLQAYHNVGKLVDIAASDEESYGAEAVSQLADFLGFSPATLYNWRAYAAEFPYEYIAEQSMRPMENGQLMTVSHWIALTRVKGEADRTRLIRKILSESLSCKELIVLLQSGKYLTNRGVSNAGRKPTVPKSIQAGVQKYASVRQQAANLSAPTNEHVFSAFDDMTADDVSEGFVIKLEALQDILEKDRSAIERDLEAVKHGVERARELVKQKSADEPASGSADKRTVKKPGKKTGGKPSGKPSAKTSTKPAAKADDKPEAKPGQPSTKTTKKVKKKAKKPAAV